MLDTFTITDHSVQNSTHLPAIIPATLPAPITDISLEGQLIKLLATSYVRREYRFFHVERPNQSFSRDDLQRSFLVAAQRLNGGKPVPRSILKKVFDTAIVENNPDQYRSIPVWTGTTVAYPGNPERRIQLEDGQCVLNAWKKPAYRDLIDIDPAGGPFIPFLHMLFPREAERTRVLDWLAWSLQNEGRKPNWAVMLYSKEKGTGKSTFCKIASRLFGKENTSLENSVEKVAAKFNGPILTMKLVVCEEVNLRPDSDLGNKLKTLITEPFTTTERKGRDVEKVTLHSCFLLTSNHLPLWIEAGERRFYVVDVGHEGHASGPNAAAFTKVVSAVEDALQDERKVAAFYQSLMTRTLAEDFDPMSLNTTLHGTEVMKRLLANQMPATTQQLKEYLDGEGAIAIAETAVRAYVRLNMHLSVNAIRHMMSELGWKRHDVKWGGKDYTRALWTAPDHSVDRGSIVGPNGFKQAVCDVLWASEA